jgi:metal-responsive CopG/Arc/MetJ family transcriptional regulator
MVVNIVCTKKLDMGRKKEFPVRITLPLSEEMAENVDEALTKDEDRVTWIRDAIDRKLKKRERKA